MTTTPSESTSAAPAATASRGFEVSEAVRRRNRITAIVLAVVIAAVIALGIGRSFTGKGPSYEGMTKRQIMHQHRP